MSVPSQSVRERPALLPTGSRIRRARNALSSQSVTFRWRGGTRGIFLLATVGPIGRESVYPCPMIACIFGFRIKPDDAQNSRSKTSAGIAPDGRGGKVKFQPSTRVVLERCLRVFACARIVAPAECIHSLPSVWSKCQCVLIKCLIGLELIDASADVSFARAPANPASMSNGAISTCAHEDAYVATEFLDSDCSGCRCFSATEWSSLPKN
jgi:hypothetical protein